MVGGLVRSWMEGNHPFRGLNWSSGIELALRVISVALCSLSIIGVERLDEESRRQPSNFSRACLLAEAISLASFLGEQSSNCRACRADRRHDDGAGHSAARRNCAKSSWRDLLAEIDRQIYPDGVGAEQAPAYTAFAIELFLVAAARSRKTARLAGGHQGSACGLGRALLVAHGHRCESPGDRRYGRLPRHRNDARLANRDMLPRSSRRLRAALADPTLLRHEDPSIRDVLFGSAERIVQCSARGCARFRQAVIR